MCRSVLNDEWVSHPSWSAEDSGFIAHKKNVYEEALHRTEEERHEYDFHIEAIVRTIAVLEPINNKIAQLNVEERGSFKLKPNLGGSGKPVHFRVIKKIYGRDRGMEVMQAMQDSPAQAIPLILARLKQKEEEWKRAQREWNKVWREVDARNYEKSLDWMGVHIRAEDKKALTTKAFLGQIEAKREEQMAKRASFIDPLLKRGRKRHQLEYAFGDPDWPVDETLKDGMKLLFSFLDRTQAQIALAERKRIESFLRSFVPLFFNLDPVAFNAAFVAVIQERGADVDSAMSEDGASMIGADDGPDISGAGSSKKSNQKKGTTTTLGNGLYSGGDLRKKLLKNEQAKSAGLPQGSRSRTATPSTSRRASPTPMEVDAATSSAKSAPGDIRIIGEKKYPMRRHVFFCNTAFYTLLRLTEVSVFTRL